MTSIESTTYNLGDIYYLKNCWSENYFAIIILLDIYFITETKREFMTRIIDCFNKGSINRVYSYSEIGFKAGFARIYYL